MVQPVVKKNHNRFFIGKAPKNYICISIAHTFNSPKVKNEQVIHRPGETNLLFSAGRL
jgi:hypothetical protein